jgi:REP element-mobilizing transposase RayT
MDYHRRTIRLKNFDYSQNGFYFVTICTKNKLDIFGEIIDQKMILNRNGMILEKWVKGLESRFGIIVDTFQIMPNHIHIVFIIVGTNHDSPKFINDQNNNITDMKDRAIRTINTRAIRESPLQKRSKLSKIIGYLKMNVSKEIGMQFFQRNYFERIIRNEKEYLKIQEYISLNPRMWYKDRNNL